MTVPKPLGYIVAYLCSGRACALSGETLVVPTGARPTATVFKTKQQATKAMKATVALEGRPWTAARMSEFVVVKLAPEA